MAVAEGSAAVARVLVDPTFELIPLKNVHEQAAAVPRGRTVSVTASLTAGANTIRIAGTTSGGDANIDSVTVS